MSLYSVARDQGGEARGLGHLGHELGDGVQGGGGVAQGGWREQAKVVPELGLSGELLAAPVDGLEEALDVSLVLLAELLVQVGERGREDPLHGRDLQEARRRRVVGDQVGHERREVGAEGLRGDVRRVEPHALAASHFQIKCFVVV